MNEKLLFVLNLDWLMLVYELYTLNKAKRYELIAVLPERRMNLARITKSSLINWAKQFSGDDVESKKILFKPVRIDLLDH